TDAHSTSGAVASVGSPTLSTLATQGNIPEVWAANVDFSTLTQGDACTINAVVYPWIGSNPYALATITVGGHTYTGQGIAWPTTRGQTLLNSFCDRTGGY